MATKMYIFTTERLLKMSGNQQSGQQAATVTAPEDWEEDWESASFDALAPPTEEPTLKPQQSKSPKLTCPTTGCGKQFGDDNSLRQHVQACVPQQVAFSLRFTRPMPKRLTDQLRLQKLLGKIEGWVRQVVKCSQNEETGTGESFGICDNHKLLSHFLLHIMSTFLLGGNISCYGDNLENVMNSYPDKDWWNKPATNKLVPFLNGLVKHTPRPIVGFPPISALAPATTPPVTKVSAKRLSEEELAQLKADQEAKRNEQQALKELVLQLQKDGFAYPIVSTLERNHVEAYIALATQILEMQSQLGLRPTHVGLSYDTMCMQMQMHRQPVTQPLEEHVAPFPQFALDCEGLIYANENVRKALELFATLQGTTKPKAGLEELLKTSATIGWQGLAGVHEGQPYCIFPFHQVIQAWLKEKKVPSNAKKWWNNAINSIKKDDWTFKFLLKKSGELNKVFDA